MGSIKEWARAAGVRAVKSMAQGAVMLIGTAATMSEVGWPTVLSGTLLMGILSILTSLAGLPEAADGASVVKIAKGDTDDS